MNAEARSGVGEVGRRGTLGNSAAGRGSMAQSPRAGETCKPKNDLHCHSLFFFFFNWSIIALQCFTTFLRGLTSLNFTCFKLQCEGFANCVQPTIVCHQVIISGEGGLAGCWGGLLGLAVT